jgi:hypothetical protein
MLLASSRGVATSTAFDRARTLACERFVRLLDHLEFEVSERPSLHQDDASLARTLTNCQRELARVAEGKPDRGHARVEQASLLAAACNALNLYAHLNSIGSPIANEVLDGVERSLDKAARVGMMSPRWGRSAVAC